MDERIIKIQHVLKKDLDDNRYQHTLGVMYTAASMAMRYDVDVLKALYAGLLHDCAKCIPNDKKLHLCGKYGFTVSDIERENPSLLHAKLGAYYARYKYDVYDQVILDAIAYHTTGRPNMTLLDKIIFVADYIEPNRKMLPEMEEIRKEAFTDLDTCVIHILKNTLDYLNKTTYEMDFMTQKTYDFYVVHKAEM